MYIARQPIFRKDTNVYGYELLFRGDKYSQKFEQLGGEAAGDATAAILTTLYESGLSNLVEGRMAFVNFDESVLALDIGGVFEANTVVIELGGDCVPSARLALRLKELKSEGFRIAVNDKVYSELELIADFIDIAKITIREDEDWNRTKYTVGEFKKHNIYPLAQHIETVEQYEQAKEAGFDLFQGFFFAKPSIVGQRSESFNNTATVYMRILKELRGEEPSFTKIAEMVRHNVDLNYKLMRMMSRRNKRDDRGDIKTIKHALAFLGLREVERWINVLMLSNVAKKKPSELIKLSLMRSLFMEQLVLGTSLRNLRYEAFTVGLFSVIEALSDVTLEDALKEVILPEEVVGALLEDKGELSDLLRLVKAYESGDFETVNRYAEILEFESDDLFDSYYQAVTDAAEIAVDIGISG